MADFTIRPTPITPFLPGVESPFASAMAGFKQAREDQRKRELEDFSAALELRKMDFTEQAHQQEMSLRATEALSLADYRNRSLTLQAQAQQNAHSLAVQRLGMDAKIAEMQMVEQSARMRLLGYELDAVESQWLMQQQAVEASHAYAESTAAMFGGQPITSRWSQPHVSTFSHMPDLSARDPEDSGISGIDGKPTHTRAGLALPTKVMNALGIDPKKARARITLADGTVDDLAVIDRGTAEWIVDRAGRPTIDLTPLAVQRLGGTLTTSNGEITGVDGVNIEDVRLYEAGEENVEIGKGSGGVLIDQAFAAEQDARAVQQQIGDLRTGVLASDKSPFEILSEISRIRQSVGNNPAALLPLQRLEQQMRVADPEAFAAYESTNQLRQLRADGIGARAVALAVNYPGEMAQLQGGKPLPMEQFSAIRASLQQLDPGDLEAFGMKQTAKQKQLISSNMIKDLNTQWKIASRAQRARGMLDQLSDDEFGQYKTRIKKIGVKWGAVHWSTHRNEFEQLKAGLTSIILKETSGAAVTDQEFQRFLEMVGDPVQLSPANFRQRVHAWLTSLETDYATLLSQYRSAGYEIPATFDPNYDVLADQGPAARPRQSMRLSENVGKNIERTHNTTGKVERLRVEDAGTEYRLINKDTGEVLQVEPK